MRKENKRPEPMRAEPVKSKKQRSLNAQPQRPVSQGLPGHEQDPKRRLGNFTDKGEHSRQGSREKGIIGRQKEPGHRK